ncbi:putative GEM-like protein [Helianthus annuus]|uniref:GEM-like protein n=1 Tax=Helianthus annuus TaxID=4232 RepID=A0A251RM97_HELAN|nr:GEM-like protein 5 [Helianthus annuus]KAF5754182.1 putative GEM-like protein [Helianthus annuus]KAJ0432133.1 putative GEM-like protein [Helianthus annuus]KAJ0811954.1 putative GEM-like protein [Helianthus annuus]
MYIFMLYTTHHFNQIQSKIHIIMAATPPGSSSPPKTSSPEDTEKWGTHLMGQPAIPTKHPDNQKAALWKASDHQQIYHQQSPYLVYTPVDKPATNPLEPVIHLFNSWTTKADSIARNIWHNLKTGPSVTGAAWGKVNLTAKAITEGGFESMFKQIFEPSDPNEKLKKTFACYLSTTTGPVAGTIYLSTARVAFCSDRPLCFTAPSGQETWSYYKVVIPLENIGTVNPVTMRENPSERYIQIVTVDGHDFWFMGFVNYEKASRHLMNSLSEFHTKVAASVAA